MFIVGVSSYYGSVFSQIMTSKQTQTAAPVHIFTGLKFNQRHETNSFSYNQEYLHFMETEASLTR
jgi:hypothetical protein